MGLLTKFYDKAPVCVQNLMCSAKGWQICRRRYGKGFYQELHNYTSNRAIDRTERLRDFLILASTIEGYKGVLTGKEVQSLKDGTLDVYTALARFPILDKQKVKHDVQAYSNPAYQGRVIDMHTSGTTGSGLVFPYSVEMENKQWAIWWRYRMRLGLTMDTWCGWFGGKTIINISNTQLPYWRINRPGRQVMFSAYHLNQETVRDYANQIRTRELLWLHGYPSSLASLSSLMIENGISPITTVRFITTGAENLYSYQVNQMHKAFPNAMIRQHYGLAEGVANISQDRDGEWRIDDDFCHVELLPVENELNVCRIIGTGFSNKAFPLVRYDTGDLAHIEKHNGQTRIVSIDGRKEDYVTLPNGVRLGRLDHIFKD